MATQSDLFEIFELAIEEAKNNEIMGKGAGIGSLYITVDAPGFENACFFPFQLARLLRMYSCNFNLVIIETEERSEHCDIDLIEIKDKTIHSL